MLESSEVDLSSLDHPQVMSPATVIATELQRMEMERRAAGRRPVMVLDRLSEKNRNDC